VCPFWGVIGANNCYQNVIIILVNGLGDLADVCL
jgi:hypothetical protein